MISVILSIFLIAQVYGFIRHSLPRRDISTKSQLNDSDIIPPLKDTPPLKVLLVVEPTPFTYISGYSNRFKEMLNHLSLAGDDVRILTPDSGERMEPPEDYKGFPIKTVRGFEFVLYKGVTLSFDTRLNIRKFIKEFKPDIVHCATPSALLWPTLYWTKYYNIPLVFSYHTNFVEYARTYLTLAPNAMAKLADFLVTNVHSAADLTLCTSPQLADNLIKDGVPRVDVWRKGINTEIFSPAFKSPTMREKLSQGNVDAPLLLYVGRLGREKRIDRLKRVLDENPGCQLALVGNGPAEKELKELFKDYSQVHFVGPLTGVALSEAFASSDIFVMPSDSETLGFVVLEALASGVPVVGVAAGGLIDIIENDHTGYLVNNDDNMKEFTEATTKLIQNIELRQILGSNARKYAFKWSWESATSVLRNIQYRQAILNHQHAQIEKEQIQNLMTERGYFYRPDLA